MVFAETFKSLLLFIFAGVLEILGGWLIWKWLRDDRSWLLGLGGALLLVLYGVVPTLQVRNFARTYAAYGGFFIALAFAWGAMADGHRPDAADGAGTALALLGVLVIYYWPR